MRGFRFVLPVVASVVLAGAAQAAPTVSGLFNSEAAYDAHLLGLGLEPTNDRLATTSARIGNNNATATTGFTGWWEGAVFVPNANPPSNSNGVGTAGNFVWPTQGLSMSLTRAGANMTFSVGGFSQQFTFANVGLVDTIGLQLSSQVPGSNTAGTGPGSNSASWGLLTLTSLVGGIATQTAADGADLYQVVTGIAGDFTLAGNITLAFDPNSLPGRAQLSFRIATYAKSLGTGNVTPVPVPAALAMFGLGILVLGGVVSRRRA